MENNKVIKINTKKLLPIAIILSLSIGTLFGGYIENVRASNELQSQGKLVYENNGEELVIDTNDFKVLQEDISANESRITSLEKTSSSSGKQIYVKDYTATTDANGCIAFYTFTNKEVGVSECLNAYILYQKENLQLDLYTWDSALFGHVKNTAGGSIANRTITVRVIYCK